MSRAERVAEVIKKEISEILQTKVGDPRIGFVSITDVEISPDLKFAKIFVSIYGDEDAKQKAMKGLASATRFVRLELGKRIDLREMPDIVFKRDDSIERGSRILAIMRKLEEEKKAPPRVRKRASKKK